MSAATMIIAARITAIPVAAAVVVSRYRLYDIDLVIPRSLLAAEPREDTTVNGVVPISEAAAV